jgi:predicted patatin/cPLA2 family phospholipase
MKRGLILEGGAMRGLFTAGVLDVLMENGIEFDGTIGVSAGACFGCNYKSRQIGRVLRYNLRFCGDKRYCGPGVLLREGNMYSASFCYNEVPLIHDPFDFEAYGSNPMEFWIVCTDIETGKPLYHRYEGYADHGFEWFRATAAMPLVSQIVVLDGKKLLDGGISDSVPVDYFESIGYDRNVVVLTQPLEYRKEKNPLIPLARVKYRRYPRLVDTMARRHIEYNRCLDTIAHRERRGELLVIRPGRDLDIGKTEKDPEKLRAVYEEGRRAALEKLDAVRDFLACEG